MNYNIDEIKKKLDSVDTVFFDLDGTLIDTEKLFLRFWKEGAKYCGYELSDVEALNMRSIWPEGGEEYLTKVSGGILDYKKVKIKRIEFMNEYLKTHPIEIKENAIELLTKLKKENKQIYIVSSRKTEETVEIMNQFHFAHLIDNVLSAKDVKRGKPFPDVYLKAASLVHKDPKDIVVFEDSPNGSLAANRAGCFTVFVEDLTEYTPDMTYIDGAINNFKVLL